MDELKKLVGQFAPVLATALGGPLAGLAVKTLAEHFGVAADEQSVVQAVQAASPADLLALKQLDLDFARLSVQREQAYLGDTQSARDRDVSLAERGYRNTRANTMLAGAGLLVVAILWVAIWKSPLDEYVKGLLTLILGRALGYVDQGFNFEFGTTRSSAKKDETISALSK